MSKKISLIGLTFGKLTVIADAGKKIHKGGQRHSQSLCRCQCGTEIVVPNMRLKRGQKSCGCWTKELISKTHTTHGHRIGRKNSRTYDAYNHMIARCYNPNVWAYQWYGKLGKFVCAGLRHSFENFLEAIGECPPKLEIDRWPDPEGNYTCGKCQECTSNGWPFNLRWATKKQQMRNRADNLVVTVRGITACLSELVEKFGGDYARIYRRIVHYKWPVELAFFAPKSFQYDHSKSKAK